MKLNNKVAIITGGTTGIGKAIAIDYLREGAKVVIVGRNEEKGLKAVDEINNMFNEKDKVFYIKADVSLKKEVSYIVSETIKVFKKIDILVNNAGIIWQSSVVDLEEKDWDRVINVNLKGCFLCCQATAKKMIEQNSGGKIINVSSIHAQLSEPQAGAYTASKGGMEAFSRTLATELAPYKINVNVIEPGATFTELTVPMYTEAVKKALYQRITLKEIAQPEMISPTAVFLASDDSYYITGQVIVVDGGYIMDGSLPGAKYWSK
jgi:NAD(P)-dependent dehydrogenase (short-subunit alcohol dehydrogenase family)